MEFYEETLNSKCIYDGKVIKVRVEDVKLPNGKVSKREIVDHVGAVAIVAFKDENTIILVKQFRKALDEILTEIPAGKLELNENPKEAAIRELEEETGYKAKKVEFLGKIATSVGFCNEIVHIFKATELYEGKLNFDEDEFIELEEVKLNEVKTRIRNGEIIDGKTVAAMALI
ncbi:NUDIX hydrolase [Clostridium ihumii]|uniref:NUDIX hydrolase n=1 Tax=Clostridium ihumii TaxID=1470356 RepID=UPI003D348755